MRLGLSTLAALLIAAAGTACVNSTMPGSSTVSASVTAVSPTPNTLSAARGDTVVMTVSMPMDTASCRSRFTLHMGDSTGAAVPGHMSYGGDYTRMMFVPDSLLQPGTRYFAEMRDSVMVGDGMGGMSGSGMMGGQHQTMMFAQMPTGAIRMQSGMGWYFTTSN